VLNADDPTCVSLAEAVKSKLFWFSRKKEVGQGAFVRDGHIFFRDADHERVIMPIAEISLKGAHNIENVLAAASVGMLMGCDPVQMRKTIHEFKAVEHRLEYVATIRGVEFYNDSKATNVDATIKAIESFPANIHLILGGKDKGSDYSVLNDLLQQRVKAVYTIGAAAEKIESQIKATTEIIQAGTLDSAVKRAAKAAQPGDIVLLAPACASFDQFQNYEQRGKTFKEIVKALA
jgi:UDP-N-acetylmuramoylalanine--D-glutamate ligase